VKRRGADNNVKERYLKNNYWIKINLTKKMKFLTKFDEKMKILTKFDEKDEFLANATNLLTKFDEKGYF